MRNLLIVGFLLVCLWVQGQEHSPRVFANGGSVANVGSMEISFTIGEPLVPTVYMYDMIVSQGFQQPYFQDDCPIFFPNAFTPNNDDQLNELFKPVYVCDIKVVSFEIYDRWGKLMYNTNDLTEGWDGTWNGSPLDQGVYSYLFVYEDREGLYTKTKKKYGIVHLLQ
jgi:gliding motility-associated-like protein